jgi:hypothetical protein
VEDSSELLEGEVSPTSDDDYAILDKWRNGVLSSAPAGVLTAAVSTSTGVDRWEMLAIECLALRSMAR